MAKQTITRSPAARPAPAARGRGQGAHLRRPAARLHRRAAPRTAPPSTCATPTSAGAAARSSSAASATSPWTRRAPQAEQLRASVSLGADPVAERAKRRAVPTFADFARDRYLPHVQRAPAQRRATRRPTCGCASCRSWAARRWTRSTQDDVAALRRKLIAEGLAPGTVNRHLATLRSMFNLALQVAALRGQEPGRLAGHAAGAAPGPLPHRGGDPGAGAGAGRRAEPGRGVGAGAADPDRRAQAGGAAGDGGSWWTWSAAC